MYFEVVPSTVTQFWTEIQAILQTVIQTNIIFTFWIYVPEKVGGIWIEEEDQYLSIILLVA